MKIDEAVKKAMETNGYICRNNKDWGKDYRILIKPTNSYECCILVIFRRDVPQLPQGSHSRSWWNPTADDLMADDWEVIKEESLRQRTEDS